VEVPLQHVVEPNGLPDQPLAAINESRISSSGPSSYAAGTALLNPERAMSARPGRRSRRSDAEAEARVGNVRPTVAR
jgi:hypothetical protein